MFSLGQEVMNLGINKPKLRRHRLQFRPAGPHPATALSDEQKHRPLIGTTCHIPNVSIQTDFKWNVI